MTSLALRSSRPLFLHRRAVVGRRMRCPCAVPGGQGDPQPQASTSGQVGSDFALHPFQSQLAGKSFMCTMCGKCCTGAGEVWVSEQEAARIAKHLNLGIEKFYSQYCKEYGVVPGWRLLRNRQGTEDCVFLVDKQCSIHNVRPGQCSTYPWWPDLMSDADWKWEKENICEGFDHPEAPPLDVDDAARQLREATQQRALQDIAAQQGKDGQTKRKKYGAWGLPF